MSQCQSKRLNIFFFKVMITKKASTTQFGLVKEFLLSEKLIEGKQMNLKRLIWVYLY